MTWHAHAACRSSDTAVFFPDKGQSAAPARAICAGCPVKAECLEEALSGPSRLQALGIWGGRTERERKAMRRQRRRRGAA